MLHNEYGDNDSGFRFFQGCVNGLILILAFLGIIAFVVYVIPALHFPF